MTVPLSEYAFLSDCHTAALVGPDGAVEWMCGPRFDGPAHFARLLDRRRGGAWELDVAGAGRPVRRYLDPGLVLESRWSAPAGEVVVHDFLALREPDGDAGRPIAPEGVLVRLVRCERGAARVTARLDARPDFGRAAAAWRPSGGAVRSGDGSLWVSGDPGPGIAQDDTVRVAADLRAGEVAVLALGYDGGAARPVDGAAAAALLERTVGAWRDWSALSDYDGVDAERVRHSAVVLRGLMFDETGALLAAPTTSLPEWIGGSRNWDYRYAWHRDAALVVLVLLRLGHAEEAGHYLRFLLEHCRGREDRLEPMLGIDGGTGAEEHELDHLDGYAGSRPVRIGNEAFGQHQIDTYGQVLDAALAYQAVTRDLSAEHLDELWRIVDALCARWREPDHGKWEVRDDPRHWTHSKVLAWVALDRGVRLAELCGATGLPLDGWRAERDAVHAEVLERGTDAAGAFVQSYGAANRDASLLQVPLLGFLDGDDPRVLATLEAVDAELGAGGFLVHRYDPQATDDGLGTPEGAFLLSSFEMVSALVLAGRVDRARERYARLCARSGPFGLFSEEMAGDGTMLGNYPQAFTHLALIDAALNLDAAGHRDALHDWAERHVPAPGDTSAR
ncbi:MAG TPA: glycoside hydrolase family 15 protein [Pseudonocardia sp.]|nr:glycoside hydrolase family 15 protein [Pseudonocardia sp.]